jgi:hypothetical protein
MLNLDHLTTNYIELNFLVEDKPSIYGSFSLLDDFGIQHYEDKYIDLITSADNNYSEVVVSNFLALLRNDLLSILTEHHISLNSIEITLGEYIWMVTVLSLMQSLENYDTIGYRLYGNDSPRTVFIDLVCSLSPLDKCRVMEIVADVNPALIESMKQLVEDKTTPVVSNHTAADIIIKFSKYIGSATALGNTLINSSTFDIELKDLKLVLGVDVVERIDSSISREKAQATLDILSLLLICKDSQNDPLTAFKEHSHLFTEKPENVTLLEPLLRRMYQDFKAYADNTKE